VHGNPERWKRFGDLLLANQADVVRKGEVVLIRDLFDESIPLLEIEVDPKDSMAEAAQKYFRLYTKAKHAQNEVNERLKAVQLQIDEVQQKQAVIIHTIDAKNLDFLRSITEAKKPAASQKAKPSKAPLPNGIRSFISTDGYTILVGKKATDNDVLTFKVAQSRDAWMHAADYPGSHVVVRNPNRKEVPQRTLLEAAQLAAFYSQGKKQTKAAVNYTEKKFVNKPKGAAPGLVRLASFKTILVEPVFPNVKPN
jgi:predicted ribosome quality control (RQC) complex YloA/Tae2 family protein